MSNNINLQISILRDFRNSLETVNTIGEIVQCLCIEDGLCNIPRGKTICVLGTLRSMWYH